MLHLKPLFPLHNTEARQHQGNLDVTSDVVLSCCCCCCPSAGAELRDLVKSLPDSPPLQGRTKPVFSTLRAEIITFVLAKNVLGT